MKIMKTNIFDRQGKELSIGDTISINHPGRDYEEHVGDNIPTPSGRYMAKLEPFIKTVRYKTVWYRGSVCLMMPGESKVTRFTVHPVSDIISQQDNTHDLIMAFDTYSVKEWLEPEDGDLAWLLAEYDLETERDLAAYVSSFDIVAKATDSAIMPKWETKLSDYSETTEPFANESPANFPSDLPF